MEQKYRTIRNKETGKTYQIPVRPKFRHNDWQRGNRYATNALKKRT